MSPKEINCVTELLIYILNLKTFVSIWIRIHKAPEYGSNTLPDLVPDPQHWLQ